MLIVSLVLIMYSLFNSAVFETDKLEWTGLYYLTPDELNVYVNLELINVWRLDTSDLIETLVEHPWIETAKVSWRWPNRIIVKVTECKPIAQIPSAGGWILMDRDGTLLPSTQGISVYQLPIVNNLDLDSTEQISSTARFIRSIPDILQHSISEFNVKTRSFINNAGTEIIMGQSVELKEKFNILERILADLTKKNQKAKKIDLRVPRNPVVTIL